MKRARLFKNGKEIIVSADDVKAGIYERSYEFVDLEENFKVTYVKAAKCGGGPYFRLYYNREDYQKMSDEQKSKYDILSDLRHWQNGPWHNEWQERLSSFTVIEKYIKNPETGKYKFADSFYEKGNLIIELQHSFIDRDFEERNEFYNKLGYKTIWLYDLPNSTVKYDGKYIEILEDNARGFFKIAEKPDNLKDNLVFIQIKNDKIYRVRELQRKEINNDKLKSSIRYFELDGVYSAEEFINKIKNLDQDFLSIEKVDGPNTLFNLWEKEMKKAVFKQVDSEWYIRLTVGPSEQLDRFGEIKGNFSKDRYFPATDYELKPIWYANEKRWILVWSK